MDQLADLAQRIPRTAGKRLDDLTPEALRGQCSLSPGASSAPIARSRRIASRLAH